MGRPRLCLLWLEKDKKQAVFGGSQRGIEYSSSKKREEFITYLGIH